MGIFYGEQSKKMWKAINTATTVEELVDALYFVCCKIQELESEVEKKQPRMETSPEQETVFVFDSAMGGAFVPKPLPRQCRMCGGTRQVASTNHSSTDCPLCARP
jgi:hypothetical protein